MGERLRQARITAGLSQAALARTSGIGKSRLSRYENDHVVPSLATLARLADALHVSPGMLLQGDAAHAEEFLRVLQQRGITLTSGMEVTLGDALASIQRAGPIQRAADGPTRRRS